MGYRISRNPGRKSFVVQALHWSIGSFQATVEGFRVKGLGFRQL